MTTCDFCDSTRDLASGCVVDAVHRDGQRFLLLPYGRIAAERSPGLTCAGCGVAWGRRHHLGCSVQRCPACAGLLHDCSCVFDEFAGVERMEQPLATVLPFRRRETLPASPLTGVAEEVSMGAMKPTGEIAAGHAAKVHTKLRTNVASEAATGGDVEVGVGVDTASGTTFLELVTPAQDPRHGHGALRAAARRVAALDVSVDEAEWRLVGVTHSTGSTPVLHLYALDRPELGGGHLIAFDADGVLWRAKADGRRRRGFRWQRRPDQEARWVFQAVAALRVG